MEVEGKVAVDDGGKVGVEEGNGEELAVGIAEAGEEEAHAVKQDPARRAANTKR